MTAGAARELGTIEVIVLGLTAAFGAGVFAVWGPAAAAAGGWLPLAVALAAAVALCTAMGTADVVGSRGRPAALGTPAAGAYGAVEIQRELLPPGLGRLGAVAFLVGRTAGVAAAAGVFGAYVLPSHPLPAAIAVVVGSTLLRLVGVRTTVLGSFAVVGGTCAVLLMAAVIGLLDPSGVQAVTLAATPPPEPLPVATGGLLGVGTAAGFVCFGLAGLARVAVLAGHARDPDAALRRAVPVAFGVAVGAYLLIAAALLVGLGPQRLATEMAPLASVVDGGSAALGVLVRVGAAVAACSAVLALQTGLSTTIVSLARGGELPAALGVIGRRGGPCRADLLGGAVALVVLCVAGLVATIAVAACCVLVSYAVVNVTALQVAPVLRHWPRWTSGLGGGLAVLLAVLLPVPQLLVAAGALAVGWTACTLHVRRRAQ